MTQYKRIITSNGMTQYRDITNNKIVGTSDIPSAILEELDLADPNTVIDSESITSEPGDGQVDAQGNPITTPDTEAEAGPNAIDEAEAADTEEVASMPEAAADVPKTPEVPAVLMDDGKEAPASQNPFRQPSPTSEKGFGFPRRNGKTVDIFDLETPHTELRAIEGMNVPLSKESYQSKTDAEIYDRLVEIGIIKLKSPVYEQQQ